jgi:hypothetical protein
MYLLINYSLIMCAQTYLRNRRGESCLGVYGLPQNLGPTDGRRVPQSGHDRAINFKVDWPESAGGP